MGTVTLQKKDVFPETVRLELSMVAPFFLCSRFRIMLERQSYQKKDTNDDIIFHVLQCTYKND